MGVSRSCEEGLGRKGLEVGFKGYKFQLCKIMKFLEITVKYHGYHTVLFKMIRRVDFYVTFCSTTKITKKNMKRILKVKDIFNTLIALITS